GSRDPEASLVPVRTALAVAVFLVACQRDKPYGHEREECRKDATCEDGLICLSRTCVRPPPGDCAQVADGLASLELGNYAEPEERAPVVAQKRAACEAAHVTKDEATCLDAARDTYSAARCVPRMFPALATGGGGDCGAITAKVRALIAPQ